MNVLWEKFILTPELEQILNNSPSVIIPDSTQMLYNLIFGNVGTNTVEVAYDVDGKLVKEASVVRCKNGAVVKIHRGLHASP